MASILPWNHAFLGLSFIIIEHNTGVKVIAAMVETVSVMVTIQPIELNKIPAIPCTIVKGRNTAIVVSVPPITEIPTSLVAKIAACLGFAPRSICEVMFSSTTMALSTTIPMAIESDDIVMMFKVSPVAKI